jgi:hypothetical protein
MTKDFTYYDMAVPDMERGYDLPELLKEHWKAPQ